MINKLITKKTSSSSNDIDGIAMKYGVSVNQCS